MSKRALDGSTVDGSARAGDRLLAALASGFTTYDLARPMFIGVPQSPDHQPYRLAISRRHGDLVRADGSSGASEIIITSGHVGTHIDALAHISHDGLLHGGVDAQDAIAGGRFEELGVETIDPIVARGILLDVPRALGVEVCSPTRALSVEELAAALALTGAQPAAGDVLLVRTGWGRHFEDSIYGGEEAGAPGPGEAGARWLASFEPRAVGSDTIAFEHIAPETPDYVLPAHRLLLVEHGIYIIEVLDLERLAAEQVYEFTFVLSPLKLVGATGSPVRPLALVARRA